MINTEEGTFFVVLMSIQIIELNFEMLYKSYNSKALIDLNWKFITKYNTLLVPVFGSYLTHLYYVIDQQLKLESN